MKTIILVLVFVNLSVEKTTKHQLKQKLRQKHKQNDKMINSEKRENIYANLNRDPNVMARIMGNGITPDYEQMLKDENRYLIAKGIIGQEDKDDRILLGKKSNKQTQIEGVYGELDQNDSHKNK